MSSSRNNFTATVTMTVLTFNISKECVIIEMWKNITATIGTKPIFVVNNFCCNTFINPKTFTVIDIAIQVTYNYRIMCIYMFPTNRTKFTVNTLYMWFVYVKHVIYKQSHTANLLTGKMASMLLVAIIAKFNNSF